MGCFGVTLNTILKSVLADSTNAQKLAGQLELSTVQELQSTAGGSKYRYNHRN